MLLARVAVGSAQDGGEECCGLVVGEVVDDVFAVRRVRSRSLEHRFNGEFTTMRFVGWSLWVCHVDFDTTDGRWNQRAPLRTTV